MPMASYIPRANLERFAKRSMRELRPQLGEFEPTSQRLTRLRSLGIRAGFLVDTDWVSELPHPDVSMALLETAAKTNGAIEWLMPKLTLDEFYGCWSLPLAAEHDNKTRARYPTLSNTRFEARSELAHRFVVRRLLGSLATEEHLDHLCRVHACCNPMHLEVVTQAINTRRGNIARHLSVGQRKLFR